MSCLVVIPARLKATRLPNKPLAMIGDAPMVVQVWRRAMEAGVGEVVVAAGEPEIVAAVEAAGGKAVLTDPEHPSGSDRIWEVVSKASPAHDIIINLQGDVPTLEPRLLRDILKPLENPAVDIATLAAEIREEGEHTNPSVVKAVLALASASRPSEPSASEAARSIAQHVQSAEPLMIGRALYFTRATAPANDGPRYHHIGVYAYRRAALEKFVSLPPSPLEIREKLEQLRALEAGMRIDAVVVDTVPVGVDTPEDLERARRLLA